MYADNYERSSQEFDSGNPNKIGKKLGYDISLGAEYQLAKGHSLSFQTKGTFNQSLDSTMYFITERIMGMWPNMSNGIETNIIPTTIMWDCSIVEVLENYMSAVI